MTADIPLLAIWPNLDGRGVAPYEWAERAAGADVVLVMEEDLERSKKLPETNQAVRLHIVKNRGGEKGRLAYDFAPAFADFSEPR